MKTPPTGIPILASTPKREIDGKSTRAKRTPEVVDARGAQNTVLDARAKQMGRRIRKEVSEDGKQITANSLHNRRVRQEMRNAALSEPAGIALFMALDDDEAQSLWAIYCQLTAVVSRFQKYCLNLRMYPKTAKIEMMPEVVETRPDDRPDDRTEDEKHRDATNAWMEWHGHMGRLQSHHQTAIWNVVYGRVQPITDAKITRQGTLFVTAMQNLEERVDR